jgi:hypothetical protein
MGNNFVGAMVRSLYDVHFCWYPRRTEGYHDHSVRLGNPHAGSLQVAGNAASPDGIDTTVQQGIPYQKHIETDAHTY